MRDKTVPLFPELDPPAAVGDLFDPLADPPAENRPEPGKKYSLLEIARGKTWAEAEVKEED